MRLFSFLLLWYNLPFLIALGCCLLLSLMQVLGGVGDHDSDTDSHIDMDADVDADVHVDTVADAHGDAHTTPDTGGNVLTDAFSALGIGRVPLMFVLILFLGMFGAIGLLANTLLAGALRRYPAPSFFGILLASLLLGLWLTGRAGRLFSRLAPNSSTAISFEQLVGRIGMVVSPTVSSTYGRVQVKDSFGTLHTVYAVIEAGEPLPEHSEVALVGYDAPRRCFVVRNLDRIR
jgi:membrane protein implicated in regulation of membrane protease activity